MKNKTKIVSFNPNPHCLKNNHKTHGYGSKRATTTHPLYRTEGLLSEALNICLIKM
jgi:hypothetical protein